MKKFLLSAIVVFASCIFPSLTFAQSNYKTAAGLELEFGKGTTLAGPTIKSFFNNHNALQVEALLGSNYFSVGAFYQYHLSFEKVIPVRFYLGLGPEVFLDPQNNAGILLKPMAGLDYKVKKLPLSIIFDLRPSIILSSKSDFEVARFGLGALYAFR